MAKALLLSFDETDGYTKRTFVWFKFFLSFSITSESSHFSSVGILWRGSTKHQILHASRMALYGGSSVSKAWCLSWPLMASSFLCCWCDDHNIPSCVDSVAKLESEFTFGWFKGMKVWRESRLIEESMSCYHLIVARVLNKAFLGMKESGFHHDLDDWQPLRSFKPTWARGFQSLPTSPKAVSTFHSLQHQH